MEAVDLLSSGLDGIGSIEPIEFHDGHVHDVLKYFEPDDPTSSSSDDNSVARASEAAQSPQQSFSTVLSLSGGSSGASWMQMAPQMAVTGAMSAPALYSMNASASQPSTWQQYSWHSAFPSETSQPQTHKEPKVTISHSTIEKQRRDRINALIDELRELVPPCAAMRGPDGGDAKRPKHVVLSDTIAMLRHLKDRVHQDGLEVQRLHLLKQQLAQGLMVPHDPAAAAAGHPAAAMAMSASAPAAVAATSLAGAVAMEAPMLDMPVPQALLQQGMVSTAAPGSAAVAAAVGSSSCPELPQAPSHLPAAVGVLVEEGPGSFLVKVNCKDRHGLLSDITSALCTLPLQISRAAITTSQTGAVYDVFEIMAEPSAAMEGLSALDVQYQVHQALYKWRTQAATAAATTKEEEEEQVVKRPRPQ